MTTVYRLTDRISYQIDDITVQIRPLTYGEKMKLQQAMIKANSGDMGAAMDAVVETVKLALKSIKGIKDQSGEDYALSFDADNKLTEECLDEILNLPHSTKLTTLCSALLNGIPTQIFNPQTGEAIEGIKYIEPKKTGKK